ncbi:nucleotidyltransferase family protein [[Archangium] primigenium]|uniref:nucleotidyltransferase family protein n=1 Tax=Melittangium TaxID=44 RepID=UPI0019576F34|nr:nucleotidyltransferase family protein [Archangium primigenium]MBM7112314.1 nucleotidyltransferase family protein [Archangium primigenium]
MRPITVVVLAAGASSRLGRPKQLVVWRGETLVHRAARIAVEADIGAVRVVTGLLPDEVAGSVSDLPVTCVHNTQAHEGLSSSIRRGVEGLDTNVLLLTCDQPLLTAEHLREMADTRRFTQASIIASSYEGVVGVPTLVAHELLPELRALQGDQGARALFEGRAVEAVVFDGGELDVDTEEDVIRLRERAVTGY